MIKTATSLSKARTDDEMDTTELEEENWIDYKKALKKPLIRWMTQRFDVGSRHTKE